MTFDPFLYAALGGGWVLGRWWRPRGPWVARITLATVMLLVGLLGASFRAVSAADFESTIPVAFGYSLLILGATAAVALALTRTRPVTPGADVPVSRERYLSSALVLASLFSGVAGGTVATVPTGLLIPLTLYALLALVGRGLELNRASLRRAWEPITASFAGALAAGLFLGLTTPWGLRPSLAVSLSFGWYSLSGPLVAARLGAALGLFAFLTNFLRELLTMVLAPSLGHRIGPEGLTALGGATSMDTTLYFVTRFGDPRAGALAIASGLTLTVSASVLVPLVLAL